MLKLPDIDRQCHDILPIRKGATVVMTIFEWLGGVLERLYGLVIKNIRAIKYTFGYAIDAMEPKFNLHNILDEISDDLCGRWLVQEWNAVNDADTERSVHWAVSGHFYVGYRDKSGLYHGQMILSYENKERLALGQLGKAWWMATHLLKNGAWDFQARYEFAFREEAPGVYVGNSEMVEKYPNVGRRAIGKFNIERLASGELHGRFQNTGQPVTPGSKRPGKSDFTRTRRVRWRDLS